MLRDPAFYALHVINNPSRSIAEVFRECQTEALAAGNRQGKCELLRIAVDTDARVRQRVETTLQVSSAKRTA